MFCTAKLSKMMAIHATITSPEPIKDVTYGFVPKIATCITYAIIIYDVRIKLTRVGLISFTTT